MIKWDSFLGCRGSIFANHCVRSQNRRKDQNHMILSLDVQKAFDKIQNSFLIKTLKKVGIEGKYLNIIKAIYERLAANIILNGKKTELPSKVRNTVGMSTLYT